MYDLFQTLDKIYTAKDIDFVNEIDDSVSPVVLNLMLSRYYKVAHVSKYLNKYAFTLDRKHFAVLAWSMIQPKLMNAPFVKKIEVLEDTTRYDFLLNKIKKRLEIGNNDWQHCKDAFLNHVRQNTVEYLVFYGCKRKEWNELGHDFEESKKIQTTEIVEGLDRWS